MHSVVERDADMAKQFEHTIAMPLAYEMLYVGEWKQNLLLADRYAEGRVFLAGDAVHLMIPTGGLGMNSGVGDAVDLSWKLAAVLQAGVAPTCLPSYETERQHVGNAMSQLRAMRRWGGENGAPPTGRISRETHLKALRREPISPALPMSSSARPTR